MERKALYHGYKQLLKEEEQVEFTVPEVEREFGRDVEFHVCVKGKSTTEGGVALIKGSITCAAVSYTG